MARRVSLSRIGIRRQTSGSSSFFSEMFLGMRLFQNGERSARSTAVRLPFACSAAIALRLLGSKDLHHFFELARLARRCTHLRLAEQESIEGACPRPRLGGAEAGLLEEAGQRLD